MKNLYLVIFMFLLAGSIISAQNTGSFDVNITENGRDMLLSYYVPENYNPELSYPLIIGMPLGGGTGVEMRNRIMPAATELGAVLVCPDAQVWDIELVQAGIDHAKQTYSINNDEVILTGHSYGGQIVFDYGIKNHNQITGIIGIAPALYEFVMPADLPAQIPLGLIVGDIDDFKMYCDELTEFYEQHQGRYWYIIKEGVDHMGPYFTSEEFKTDWLECYNFIMNNPSSIEESNSDFNCNIAPNPVHGSLELTLYPENTKPMKIILFDNSGREIREIYNGVPSVKEMKLNPDLSDLNRGIYLIIIESGKSISSKKLIIN